MRFKESDCLLNTEAQGEAANADAEATPKLSKRSS